MKSILRFVLNSSYSPCFAKKHASFLERDKKDRSLRIDPIYLYIESRDLSDIIENMILGVRRCRSLRAK